MAFIDVYSATVARVVCSSESGKSSWLMEKGLTLTVTGASTSAVAFSSFSVLQPVAASISATYIYFRLFICYNHLLKFRV